MSTNRSPQLCTFIRLRRKYKKKGMHCTSVRPHQSVTMLKRLLQKFFRDIYTGQYTGAAIYSCCFFVYINSHVGVCDALCVFPFVYIHQSFGHFLLFLNQSNSWRNCEKKTRFRTMPHCSPWNAFDMNEEKTNSMSVTCTDQKRTLNEDSHDERFIE